MTKEELQKMLDEIPNKRFAKLSDKQLEWYANLSSNKKGQKYSQEHRNNISKSHKGKVCSQEHRKNLSISHKGKIKTKEQKEKISKSLKNKIRSKEHRKNLSIAFSKKIICYLYPSMKFFKEFDSTRIAAKELNINQSCISLICNKKRISTHGYTFKYKDK